MKMDLAGPINFAAQLKQTMTLKAIKDAIEHLQWLDEREKLAWDVEIENDFAPEGRADSLLDRVKRDIQAGKFKPFDQRRP